MQEKPLSTPTTIKASENRGLYIVGIGASAGGLEAFQEFFTHMPSDSGMAFVLVPHLDPTHKSIIGDILKKYTDMNIFQAEDGMKVQPNCVYLIQPDKNIAILNGNLQLIEPAERRWSKASHRFLLSDFGGRPGRKCHSCYSLRNRDRGTLGLKALKEKAGWS